MAQFQLAEPSRHILELVQAAVLKGATFINIYLESRLGDLGDKICIAGQEQDPRRNAADRRPMQEKALDNEADGDLDAIPPNPMVRWMIYGVSGVIFPIVILKMACP